MQNRAGQWLLSNSSCFIYKLLAHSSVQREKWSIKSIHYSVLTVWILLREKKKIAFNILPPRCWRNTVWSRACDTDMYVNLLLLNVTANSHGEDLWTPLSPTATSHQRSLLPCVSASLISHHTPSAASPPIWHRSLCGDRPKHAIHASAHIDHFSDADWSMQVINRDTGSTS